MNDKMENKMIILNLSISFQNVSSDDSIFYFRENIWN